MLPEIGASELLVVAIVALIVVGPKDLPLLLRKLGQFMARLRGMAAEFRASFDEMARQSELDDLRKEVEAMRRGQLADIATQAAGAEAPTTFADINQSLMDVGVDLQTPVSYQYGAELALEDAPLAKPTRKPRAKVGARKAAKAETATGGTKPKAAAKPRTRKPAP
jgi:sec-independent protein translocase protein TatB